MNKGKANNNEVLKETTSTIAKCTYTSDWETPSGTILHFHQLQMLNGDIGNIGVTEKNPAHIQPGIMLVYTIDAKKKLKIVSQGQRDGTFKAPATKQKSTKPPYIGAKQRGPKPHDEFLGYAWSYAKDLLIAGKTMNDVAELDMMATYIYMSIGKMLKGEE